MDIYAEIEQKRAERFARRQARLEHERRIESIVGPIKRAGEFILSAIIMYAFLFAGALWASM